MSKIIDNISVQNSVLIQGRLQIPTTSTAGNLTLDEHYMVNVTAAATITLPDSTDAKYNGTSYIIIKLTEDTVTITTQTADKILEDGSPVDSVSLAGSSGQELKIVSNGSQWQIYDIGGSGDAPTAPLNPTATAADGGALITFDSPTSDGGAEITLYKVTSTPGSITAVNDTSPIAVNGLANNTSYTFVVQAMNSAGWGPASETTAVVTPSLSAGSSGTLGIIGTVAYTAEGQSGGGGNTCQMLVAGDGPNTLGYSSTEGLTWAGLGNIIFDSGEGALCIAHNGSNFWVAGGEGTLNTLAYSTDGVTFLGTGKGVFSTRCRGVAYSSSLDIWVAVGQGTNTIAYSEDGITWFGVGDSITNMATGGYGIAWDGSTTFVVVGRGTNNIATSTDGISWSYASGVGINTPYGIAYQGGRWVSVTENATNKVVFSDDDGANWTAATNQLITGNGYAIAYNGKDRWMAGGSGTNTLIYSDDNGENWTAVGSSPFTTACYGICFVARDYRWVAVGEGTNTIAYSQDNGETWTGLGSSIFSTVASAVVSCDELPQPYPTCPIIALGYDSTDTIAYSVDGGTTWTGLGKTIFTTQGTAIASDGDYNWIATGRGANTLAYSNDGITWVGLGSTVFSVRGNGVGVGDANRWVAVGQGGNTLAYSDNYGTSWTQLGTSTFDISGQGIAYDNVNDRWVAVGIGSTNTIAYSDDNGVTWTGIGKTIFTKAGYGVAHNGVDQWVAVGEGTNTVAYSPDGVSWTGDGTSTFSSIGFGVVYHPYKWIATGTGTNTLAYSADGISWTGVGSSIFTTAGRSVTYDPDPNILKWVATGEGTNTVATSADGISWSGSATTIFSGLSGGYGIASCQLLPPPDPPITQPSPPLNATIAQGVNSLYVSFDPPVSDGGQAIVDYEVTLSPGGATATGASSPITVTGITDTTYYTATVTANNGVAVSAPSDPTSAMQAKTRLPTPTISAYGYSSLPNYVVVIIDVTNADCNSVSGYNIIINGTDTSSAARSNCYQSVSIFNNWSWPVTPYVQVRSYTTFAGLQPSSYAYAAITPA